MGPRGPDGGPVMEAALRHSLEQIAGTLDKELTDDGSLDTEALTRAMLQSEAFVALRAELARDARAAAAACTADDATGLAETRARLLRAVPSHGAIGQALETLIATPAEPSGGVAEWWAGGEDGVLDLDALDADSQDSLPQYEQLAVLAQQLHSADAHQRRAAFDALERYREHGLMGCPDWPAVCRALQKSLGDPVLALAERALQWHEELFVIAAAPDAGEDAEVTQCADVFHNLTQHLLERYRAAHSDSSPRSLAPEAVAASWHRAALGLVGAGWSLIHERSIYECARATAQLMAIPEAMLVVAAIDPCALWFRRWVLAMHRRRRTFSCMAASAPELGAQLLATLERGGIGSVGTAPPPRNDAEPESEDAVLVLQHTVGVVSALMMFPEGAGAVLGPCLCASTAAGPGAAAAAVRDGSVGVHVMALLCGVMTAIPAPHLRSRVCSQRLWETCAEALKVIAQRHPAAALRLMQLQQGDASELQREVGEDATAVSVVVACGIEEPMTRGYIDAGETDALSWLLQEGQPGPGLSSTGTQSGDSSDVPTAHRNMALRSIVHALEFTAAILESSVCTDAMIQADRVDVRRRTRHQRGQAEAGTMKTSATATDAAGRDSVSEELCVTHGRAFAAVMRFSRWLVSGCSANVQEAATLSASEHRSAATSAFSTARARARLVVTESAEGLTAAAMLLHSAARIWRTVGSSSDGIARLSAVIGQPYSDVPSFLLQILQGSLGVATEKCVSGAVPSVLPRELLKSIASCLAEWSTRSAGWAAVAAASTATQSASDRAGVEARESEVEGRDDRGSNGEAAASLSLLLPRLLVVSRGDRSHASRGYSGRAISALLEPALAKRAMSTLLSTRHGTSALLAAGLVGSLLLELKATILDPAPATVLALAEPPPLSLLPQTWCERGTIRGSDGLYAADACSARITNDAVAGLNQMALVHEVALVLASPTLLHALLQPMAGKTATYAPAATADADGSLREASAMLRQIVMSVLRAQSHQQQEMEETVSDQWLTLSDDGVHVVLRVLFHVATASPAAAALLDESFGLSASLAAALRATCLSSSASESGTTSVSVTVDALSLERWRLWSALGAAGNFGGISPPPLPPPDIDMANTAADELRRALLELKPETETETETGAESTVRTTVVATNSVPQTELDECELLELAELAHSYGLAQQASNARTVGVPDPREGRDKDQLASQLRVWWLSASADSLLTACARPPTARLLLRLIVAGQRSDGVAAAALGGDEPAGAMRRQRLSWLEHYLSSSIGTATGALPHEEAVGPNRDFVASLVEALGRQDGLTTPPQGSEGLGSRLSSESVLGRVGAAVEALLEAELPALASVLIHGAHGHTYGTVSLLVQHWCTACFCTGVIPAWCDAPPFLRRSDPMVLCTV